MNKMAVQRSITAMCWRRGTATAICLPLALTLLSAGCGGSSGSGDVEQTSDKPATAKPEATKAATEAGASKLTEAQFRSYLEEWGRTATGMASEAGSHFAENGEVDVVGLTMLQMLYGTNMPPTWKKLGISDSQTCLLLLESHKSIVNAARPWVTKAGFSTGKSNSKIAADALMQAVKESWQAFEAQLRAVSTNDAKALNVCDLEGFTPLMYAAQDGHAALVKWLLPKGANLKAQNAQGQTALDLAQTSHNDEIVALLKQAGAQ